MIARWRQRPRLLSASHRDTVVTSLLLDRSQHDYARAKRAHLLTGRVDDAPRQSSAWRHCVLVDIVATEHSRPSDLDGPLAREIELRPRRIARRTRNHQRQPVRCEPSQPILDGGRQPMKQRARRHPEQSNPHPLLVRQRPVVGHDDVRQRRSPPLGCELRPEMPCAVHLYCVPPGPDLRCGSCLGCRRQPRWRAG
jgi:hypothetical protein